MNTTRPAKRILIVDDEPENLRALRRELMRWTGARGIDVDMCDSGEEAVTRLESYEYAVLVTDNRMPGMSGTQLVRRAGRIRPTTVSIILTGYTEKHDVEAALSAGIFAFLIKPWDRENLRREIEKAMQVHYMRKRHLEQASRMNQELRMAIEFQRRLLAVTPPEGITGIVPSWHRCNADDHGVGGDYLDIRSGPDGRYAVLLGDVSGHGMRTAFVAAMLKAVLTPEFVAQEKWISAPSVFLAWLNTRMCEITDRFPDMFVAFSVCIVDPEAGTITYSSAGNPLPLHQRGNHIEPVEVYGVALGVNADAEYYDRRLQLRPGDALYLYTDGLHLPEEGRERADRETIYRAILEAGCRRPLSGVVDHLRHLATTDALTDDLTAVRLLAE